MDLGRLKLSRMLAKDAKNNKKSFFDILTRKELVQQLLCKDGKMLTNSKEKAELLNYYFGSVKNILE